MPKAKDKFKYLGMGGVRIGGVSNYTDFGKDGRQVMAGTARTYGSVWLPAQMWFGIAPDMFANAFNMTISGCENTCTPIVKPKLIYGGMAAASPIAVPALSASCAQDTDARASTAFFAPPDAASSGSSTVKLFYTTAGARTAGNIQAFRVRWQYFGTATSDIGGVSGSFLYGASMASTGSGKLEIQTLGQINAFRSSSPLVVLELAIEGSNASSYAAAPGEQIYGMQVIYVRENLGVQVT